MIMIHALLEVLTTCSGIAIFVVNKVTKNVCMVIEKGPKMTSFDLLIMNQRVVSENK